MTGLLYERPATLCGIFDRLAWINLQGRSKFERPEGSRGKFQSLEPTFGTLVSQTNIC